MLKAIERKNDDFIFTLTRRDGTEYKTNDWALAESYGSTRKGLDYVLSAGITGFAKYCINNMYIRRYASKIKKSALEFLQNSKNGDSVNFRFVNTKTDCLRVDYES